MFRTCSLEKVRPGLFSNARRFLISKDGIQSEDVKMGWELRRSVLKPTGICDGERRHVGQTFLALRSLMS